jgi:hypothetical protein
MRLNPPTPYFPTWKKSHAARNTFSQKHIQNVIIRQTGRPHMIVPGPTKKDGVIEIWKEQDRMIVRNGGALAADYEETQQTYEQAGEAPDGIAPSATNDRASGDTEEDASGNGGNETQPLMPPPKKKAVHVEQNHGKPRKSADTDKPSANTMNTTAPDKTDNHHQIDAAGNANLGTNDKATNEAGRDGQAENNVQDTVMAASEADTAQPTSNETDDGEEHADTVKHALPAKIPSVNDMKADFRGKWSIIFTNCSTRLQIEPIWKEIYQKYGPDARDLNLDYSNGSLQTTKGKRAVAPAVKPQLRAQKRKKDDQVEMPNKRPKFAMAKPTSTKRTTRATSKLSEPSEDVDMGGTEDSTSVKSQNANDKQETSGLSKNPGPDEAEYGSTRVSTPEVREDGLLEVAGPANDVLTLGKGPDANSTTATVDTETEIGHEETSGGGGSQVPQETIDVPGSVAGVEKEGTRQVTPDAGMPADKPTTDLAPAKAAAVDASGKKNQEKPPAKGVLYMTPKEVVAAMTPEEIRLFGFWEADGRRNFGPGAYSDPKIAAAHPIRHKVDSYLFRPTDEQALEMAKDMGILSGPEQRELEIQLLEMTYKKAAAAGKPLPPLLPLEEEWAYEEWAFEHDK